MRKISIALLFVLILAFTLVGCQNLNPPPQDRPVYGYLEYKKVEDGGQTLGYEVVGIGTYSSKDVLIPESYLDEPVIGIADNAFAGLNWLTSIDMFPSVTYIGNDAFANCTSIKTIGLSKNITKIGGNAFFGCLMLGYNIYENGYYLGNDENPYMVFISSVNTDGFKLNDATRIIYGSAFSHSDLSSINLPKTLINFSGLDFLDCKNLTSITVDSENEVYYSENNAVLRKADNALVFALDDFDLSKLNAEKICSYAFANWNKTDAITLGNSVCEIEDSAFAYGKFSGVNLPAGVQSIGTGIFYSCPNLTAIGDFTAENYYCESNCIIDVKEKSVLAGCQNSVIPTSKDVTLIDKSAFFYCEGLKEITIPENIVKIDDMAFYWCTSLEKVNFSNNLKVIGESAFSLCSSLKNVSLNEGIYRIGKNAFSSSSLETIDIPKSVEYIDENAFRNCTKLVKVNYASSYEDFLKIRIGEGNEKLFTAEQIFKN